MNIKIILLLLLLLGGVAGPASAQRPGVPTVVAPAPDSAVLTPVIIGQGRKIFRGQGSCFACHGNKLEGGPIAPSLRGPKWRHIDGSYEAIIHRIDEGYPGTAMVAHPGNITEAQVLMVASYIYAVSHGLEKP
jgi:mono/diheme cytochrome c family protein